MVEDDIEKVVRQIEARKMDLTVPYDNWLSLGFALVDAIGNEARNYFHRISRFNPEYDVNKCDEQFDKCLSSTSTGITAKTFFYLARDQGIDISHNSLILDAIVQHQETLTPSAEDDPNKKKRRKNRIDIIEHYLSERYQFRFNVVTSKLEVKRLMPAKQACLCEELNTELVEELPPEPVEGEATPWHPLTDYLENSLLRDLLKNNVKCSAAILRSILYSDFCIFFDPFKDYFNKLPPWDNVDHILQLSETVKTTNEDQWHPFLKKWLVAAVASVLNPKTVNHTAIILSGPQGIGKTTWLLNLCPPELSDYIFSGTINPNNKDTFLHLSECMFINMDELENMNRTEIGTFKEIITKPSIRIRRAYGHHMEPLTRRASFMGSVNSSQFLTDSTGSRRFLCFEATDINYRNNLNIENVYSQAYALYRQKFRFYFDQEEIQSITSNNEQFQVQSIEEELLLSNFQKIRINEATKFTTSSQLLVMLSEKSRTTITSTPGAVIRMGRALNKNGFEKKKSHGLYLWAIQELPSSTQ